MLPTTAVPDSSDYADLRVAALNTKYALNPAEATTTLTASVRLDASQEVSCYVIHPELILTDGILEFGLHESTGGSGGLVCPAKFMLLGLAGCLGVTLKRILLRRKIVTTWATVCVAGDFDARATLGLAKDIPVGFREIRVEVTVHCEADDSMLQKVQRAAERACVVYQTLLGDPKPIISVRPFKRQ